MNTKILRQKILDLAIRGKLTEQKESDGTTKDLLASIAASSACHAELVSASPSSSAKKNSKATERSVILSKRSASKDLAKEIIPLNKDEAPFEIPENWEWVRLGDVCELQSGFTIPAEQEREKGLMMYIKVSDMNLPENLVEIKSSQRYVDEWKDSQVIKANSIIFPKRGGAILTNKKRIVKTPILADLNIMGITPRTSFDYIYYWFQNIDLATLNNGSNIPQVNNKDIDPLLIPLPPLAEQQRIVEAIESAFAEITAIENNQELLKKHIKQGRQKILDLAIRGKLTEQKKSDGTTKDLLASIATASACHAELVSASPSSSAKKNSKATERSVILSKRSASKDLAKEIIPLDKDEAPFEIPETWEWVRLGDVCGYGDCDNVDVKKIENDAWILELEDIEKDSGKIIQHLVKSERSINGVRHSFKKGEVLYSKLRTYLNKVLVAPEDGFCTTEIMPIKTKGISSAYLCLVLRSQYFLDYTIMCGYGVKMPRLSTVDAKNGLIPLPPLAEQQRIVAAIESAFTEFDAMEKNIKWKNAV